MRELADRGVNIEQMSTVGIGESQPIATNSNDKGRALNRRVEFLLSRYEDANLIAVEKFPRNIEWLNDNKPKQDINNSIKNEKTKQLNVLKLHKNSISIVKNINNIKPEKDKIEVIPIKKSTRIVNLIPAEKVVVELLPGS
jgi:hypothetical protein